MEEITKSQEHHRSLNGKVLFDESEHSVLSAAQKVKMKKMFMYMTLSFLCVFSVMIVLLGFTMSSRTTLAIKLNDMTELYNYQNNLMINQRNFSETENTHDCKNCLGFYNMGILPIKEKIITVPEIQEKFLKSYVFTW